MIEKRKEPRYEVSDPAILKVPEIAREVYAVRVLDVSNSGLRVSCSRGLSNGLRVSVKWRNAEVSGAVRYAREVESGQFNLGVQIDKVLSGSWLDQVATVQHREIKEEDAPSPARGVIDRIMQSLNAFRVAGS